MSNSVNPAGGAYDVKAWAQRATKDKKITREEADEFYRGAKSDGKFDLDERAAIVNLLSSGGLDQASNEELVRLLFIGNLEGRPGFIPSGQRSEIASYDNIKVRSIPGTGLYEVDVTAGAEFGYPDYIVDGNGSIIVNNMAIYNDMIVEDDGSTTKRQGMFSWCLNVCGIVEKKDEQTGKYYYYYSGLTEGQMVPKNSIPYSEVFMKVACAAFVFKNYPHLAFQSATLDEQGRPKEAYQLASTFYLNGFIPLGSFVGKDDQIYVTAYDTRTGSKVEMPTGQGKIGFADEPTPEGCKNAVNDYTRAHPERDKARKK